MRQVKVVQLWACILAGVMMASGGCTSRVTIYWSKPGASPEKLQQDKEECQALQRSAGLNEDRIEKCLEAKGWAEVKRESENESSESPQ